MFPRKGKLGHSCWPKLIILGCELVTGVEYTYVVLVDGYMFVKDLVPVRIKPDLELVRRVAISITCLTMWHRYNFERSLYLYFAFNLRKYCIISKGDLGQ